MKTSTAVSYAVWFSERDSARIEKGFDMLWAECLTHWELRARPGYDVSDFDPLKRIGEGFYLFQTEAHCSPGDICGFFKGRRLLASKAEVFAAPIDATSYLPHQGLNDQSLREVLWTWKAQPERFYFESRA